MKFNKEAIFEFKDAGHSREEVVKTFNVSESYSYALEREYRKRLPAHDTSSFVSDPIKEASETKQYYRGRAPIMDDEEFTMHMLAGRDWNYLVDRGYAPSTAKAKVIAWKKRVGHPDVDHPADKCGQIFRYLPVLRQFYSDFSKLVIYESHAGEGGCTAAYKTTGGTVFAQTYDPAFPERDDSVAKGKSWTLEHLGLLINVLDIDGYGPSLQTLIDSGLLDHVAPTWLFFYTFPMTGTYWQNQEIRDTNNRALGHEFLTPERVQEGLTALLKKRGFTCETLETLKLGKPKGGIYRMVFLCRQVRVAGDNNVSVPPTRTGIPFSAIPLDAKMESNLALIRSSAIINPDGTLAAELHNSASDRVNYYAAELAKALADLDTAHEAFNNQRTDHKALAAKAEADEKARLETIALVRGAKVERATAHLAKAETPDDIPVT